MLACSISFYRLLSLLLGQIAAPLGLSRCLVRFSISCYLSVFRTFSISRQDIHYTSTHKLLAVMLGNLKRLERACVCVRACVRVAVQGVGQEAAQGEVVEGGGGSTGSAGGISDVRKHGHKQYGG